MFRVLLYGISNDIFLMAMQIVECVYDSDHRVHQSELVLAQAASSSLDLIRQSAFEFLVSAPVCGGSIMSESQVLGRYSNNILWQDGFSDEDKKDAKKKPSLDSDPLLSSPLLLNLRRRRRRRRKRSPTLCTRVTRRPPTPDLPRRAV